MPSNYTGNPTAAQPPSPAPSLGGAPILALPVAGEKRNVSSIAQSFKTLADWSAWAASSLLRIRGIFAWLSSATYQAGDVAIDNLDQHIYRALSTNGNMQPSTSPSIWERIDWSQSDLNQGAVLVTATTGFTASHGAAIGSVYMLKFASDTLRMITFVVGGVQINTYTDIDLSGATTSFPNAIYSGQCTAFVSAGTPGRVWLSPNIGMNCNVVRLTCSGGTLLDEYSTYATTCNVAVTLWGY
jgi:hypothetical protein